MAEVLLNEDQQEAINTINGPLLISAGPGKGKTATGGAVYFTLYTFLL